MNNCCCAEGVKLIYACSGCSDVGEISDRVVRVLSKEGFGKMKCLAAVGAHLSGPVKSAMGADENIAIDGCSDACARKNLEHIGVTPKSYVLTEMGLEKGKTILTDEMVDEVSKKIRDKILFECGREDDGNK